MVKISLTAELDSMDSAACLRCCPMGDSGVFAARLFNVGTVLVVNRLWRFARSRSVAEELLPCDCMRTPIGRNGGGTSDSSRGDLREFEKVMAIVYTTRTWLACIWTREVEVDVWGCGRTSRSSTTSSQRFWIGADGLRRMRSVEYAHFRP